MDQRTRNVKSFKESFSFLFQLLCNKREIFLYNSFTGMLLNAAEPIGGSWEDQSKSRLVIKK